MNHYAIGALKEKRSAIAGRIVYHTKELAKANAELEHIDATIRLFDPGFNTKGLPVKRYYRRIRLFKFGELGRMIFDVLRRAEGTPLTTKQITDAVVVIMGQGDAVRPAIARRVSANLAYQRRRNKTVV